MDISVQILATVPTHPLSGNKAVHRNISGDVITVWLATDIATKQSQDYHHNDVINPKFWFLHITDIPDGVTTIEKIREVLTRPQYENDETGIPDEDGFLGEIVAKRDWNLDLLALNNPTRTELLANNEVTMRFSQVGAAVRRKRGNKDLDISDFL